jgi:hypothetical protein
MFVRLDGSVAPRAYGLRAHAPLATTVLVDFHKEKKRNALLFQELVRLLFVLYHRMLQ